MNGTVLTCDTNQSAHEWLAVNLTSGGLYPASYFVTGAVGGPETGNEFDSFNLNENNTATSEAPTPPQKDTYWGIGIPSGVQGDCEGIIWFGALAS